MTNGTELSVVVFAFNEEANIAPVLQELRSWLADHEPAAEIIFVDDGSRDGTLDILQTAHRDDNRIKIITFRKNFGQTAALAAGFDFAHGTVVVSMDDPVVPLRRQAKLFDWIPDAEAFRVEGGHASRTSRRDGLAIVVVRYVARGINALYRGHRAEGLNPAEVAFVVHLELALKEIRVRSVPDRQEHTTALDFPDRIISTLAYQYSRRPPAQSGLLGKRPQ